MKLINFHETKLADVRKRYRAEVIGYSAIKWAPRVSEVISIDASTIEINENDNTITNKKGERIIIYIRDWSNHFYEKKGSLPKIHFYNCKTILEKIRNNSFDSRYVGAYTTTGLLNINLINKDSSIEEENLEFELSVCSNCLKDAKNDGLIDIELLSPFNLKKYFDYYEYFRNRVNNPRYNFITIAKNQYPKNWEEISKIERERVNYICQNPSCKKNCYNNKGELHVHHKDHNKGNNFTDNYEVLCYKCHSEYHDHMR